MSKSRSKRWLSKLTNLQISEWIVDEFELNGQVFLGGELLGAVQLPTAFLLRVGNCFMSKWKLAIYFITGGFKNITPILTCRSFLKSFLSTELENSENTLYGDEGPGHE